jgi:hypothetical protein
VPSCSDYVIRRAGCLNWACPEVSNKLHAQSHLPHRPPSGLSSGFRRYSSWSTGSTRAGRMLNKEDPHASTPDSPCPPPRPVTVARPSALCRLWPTLPAESRERILNALSLVVARHLATPPDLQEVTHERP